MKKKYKQNINIPLKKSKDYQNYYALTDQLIIFVRLGTFRIFYLCLEIHTNKFHCKSTSQNFKKFAYWGTWVAWSVRHPTLGFGTGHDLTVYGFVGLSPASSSVSLEPVWDFLSLPLSLPLPYSLSRSLSQNK